MINGQLLISNDQAPISKQYPITKISITQTEKIIGSLWVIRTLVIGIYLELGIWLLGFDSMLDNWYAE